MIFVFAFKFTKAQVDLLRPVFQKISKEASDTKHETKSVYNLSVLTIQITFPVVIEVVDGSFDKIKT